MEYLILFSGWAGYFILHSALASTSVKQRFSPRPFRLFYAFLSIAGLFGLLMLNGSIKADPFFVSKGPVRYLSLVLTTFGVMIIQRSFRQYSLKGFVGISEEPMELKKEGILKYVRHPIYSGTILVVFGFFFFIPNLPTLVSCLCMLAYVPIGIYLEEKKLIASFGENYREYKRSVPSIIPFLK